MTPEQFEFVMAIEAYKKVNKRPLPDLDRGPRGAGASSATGRSQPREIRLDEVPEPPLRHAA